MKRDVNLEYKVLAALIESPEIFVRHTAAAMFTEGISALERLQRESSRSYAQVAFALLCLQDMGCVVAQPMPSERWRITVAGYDRYALHMTEQPGKPQAASSASRTAEPQQDDTD